jgi:Tfp pilus assembly protein PilN
MLQNSLIYNPAQADEAAPAHAPSKGLSRWLPVSMVVPRDLCTYHRVSCAGVPFYKLQEFARLQALQHAPFVQFGASAVRQGQTLHLWIWDQQHETRFAQQHSHIGHFQAIAQSLFSRPIVQGVVWLATPTGHEAQLWLGKKLQDSQWFAHPPSAHDWAQRQAQNPELAPLGWPARLPPAHASVMGSRPWSINLITRQRTQPPLNWTQLSNATLLLGAAALLGWGGWLQGQIHGHQARIQANQAQQENIFEQQVPQQQARVQTLNAVQRIQRIQALNAQTRSEAVLVEVNRLLSRQGLWVREIDLNGSTVEATLIAPPGVTPRLTAILGVLENSALFHDARFVDVVPGAGFKFAWRVEQDTLARPPL